MPDRVALIANPASGGGKGARQLPSAKQALAEVGLAAVYVTECADDEARVARVALDAGATVVAVLGGDGSWSKVAAAMIAAGSDARLAPMAGGKGNDFAKSLHIPARDYAAVAQLIASGESRRVDAGRASWGDAGAGVTFVNCAGFGFDAMVVEQIGRVKWLRGDALYIYASLRELFGYAGIRARMVGHGDMATHLMLVASNGRNFGGSFLIAPRASVTDGALDFVTIADAGPLRRLALFAKAVRGRHVGAPEVRMTVARSATFEFEAPPILEVDGDLYRASALTVRIESMPDALRVIGGSA